MNSLNFKLSTAAVRSIDTWEIELRPINIKTVFILEKQSCKYSLTLRQAHVYYLHTMSKLCCHLLTTAATPNPVVMEESCIPSAMPRDTDPPELILSFNVIVAPPTYVTCQVGNTPVSVAVLSREVTAGLYSPLNTGSPVTNVTVTLRRRQAGNYTCTVLVYRGSGDNLTTAITSPISILGGITMTQ